MRLRTGRQDGLLASLGLELWNRNKRVLPEQEMRDEESHRRAKGSTTQSRWHASNTSMEKVNFGALELEKPSLGILVLKISLAYVD